LDNRALKKLLTHMDDKEFYKIFKTVDLKQITIQGFERKKYIDDIPKPIIINSFFQQNKKQFKAMKYIYNYYANQGEYRFSKFDKNREAEEMIGDISRENQSQMLVWLLSHENETFRKAACDYINSDAFFEKSNGKISSIDDVKKMPENDQKEEKQSEMALAKLIGEVDELKSKIKKLELKNTELNKRIEITKENNSELNQKLKKAEAEIGLLNKVLEKKDETIERLNQNNSSLLTDNAQLYAKYLSEMPDKEETKKNEVCLSKTIVITNQQYRDALCQETVYICRQDEIGKILEEWDLITDIYVSDCCISEGNRRKLMKKKKEDNKNIKFLNEKMIDSMIYGGH